MERRRSLCFPNSDEEDEDEDHMQRISMCFSLDISERVTKPNRFHNLSQISVTDRMSRNPGGGLFGSVEDGHNERSFLSFTVPNRFYEDSRDDAHGYDKYSARRSIESRRKTLMPYEDHDDRWPSEHYERNCYQRYNKARQPKESYDFPRPLKSHRTQRNYNSPRCDEYTKRPRREHYQQREAYDNDIIMQPIPEFIFKRKSGRQEKHFEDNYNSDFPTKFRNRSCSAESNNYAVNTFNEPPRNGHRRKSGYSGREYEPYYESYARPACSDCYYYNNRPTKRKYSDLYECSQMYRTAPYQRKSVDFFSQDCEIPYNILKRPRNVERRNRYAESQSCLRISAVDIPYKSKRRKYRYEPEPDGFTMPKRTESGSDMCRKRCIDDNFIRCCKRPTRAFNPLTRSSHRIMQNDNEICCKKSRKSLKQKISGFFKRSKCKSRTKCCGCRPRGSQLQLRKSKTCKLDHFKSVSSISCIVVQSKRPVCKPTKQLGCCPLMKRTKCIAYPTVYRDKCPCCVDPDEEDEELLSCPSLRPKVNCCQFECETTKCCCESCRQCEASSYPPNAIPTIDAPSYCSFNTDDPISRPRQRNSCCSLSKEYKKLPRIVCEIPVNTEKICCSSCCSTEELVSPEKNCCCSTCASKTIPSRKACCIPGRASQTKTCLQSSYAATDVACPRRQCCECPQMGCSAEHITVPRNTCCSTPCETAIDCLGQSKKEKTQNACCGGSSEEPLACPSKPCCCASCAPKEDISCPRKASNMTISKKTSCCVITYVSPKDCSKKSSCSSSKEKIICSKIICENAPKKSSCCADSCANGRLPNQMQRSTINVCLKICTADGNLLEPPRITTSVDPKAMRCEVTHLGCSDSTPPPPNEAISSCPSKTSTCCPIRNSKCDCTKISAKDCCGAAIEASTSCHSTTASNHSKRSSNSNACTVCSENNYNSVRTEQLSSCPQSNITCKAAKAPKPILSTSNKNVSYQCCAPHKKKSVETVDRKKCPSLRCCCSRNESLSQDGSVLSEQNCPAEQADKCCRQRCCPAKEDSLNNQECCMRESCPINIDILSQSPSCVRKSSNQGKKSIPKVEFACNTTAIECPRQCDNRPSIVEELKMELLENLINEEKLNCQLPYQKPTPHIRVFPCAPADKCAIQSNPCQCKPNPYITCWRPL